MRLSVTGDGKTRPESGLPHWSPPGFDNIQRIGREVHLDTGGFVVAVVLGLLWRFGQSAKIRV